MRRIVYCVAASLDGYIAAADGGYDWIPMDPDFDFAALYARFDTFLMGRGTYETWQAMGGFAGADPEIVVFSSTLRPEDHPGVEIVSGDAGSRVRELRDGPGRDIWLYGGGELFRGLLEEDLVDAVEVAVVPVLLGGGIPLLPPPAGRRRLRLAGHQVSPKTGTVLLEYEVVRGE